MREDLIRQVEKLDREYFGNRPLGRLVSALAHQIYSMQKEPTLVNVRKQVGDILFILVAISRNLGWELEELLFEAVTKIENRRKARHYYEAHITVEPVFGERLEQFKEVCKTYDFHVAILLMQKRQADTSERSSKDSFCTGRSISYSDLEDRTLAMVKTLQEAGFTVWRYKIESTLLDSRYSDSKFFLVSDELPEKERNPGSPAAGALSGRDK